MESKIRGGGMAGRVKNAKKLFLTGIVLLLVLSTGCMNKSTELAEGFDEDELKKVSGQVVDQFNKNDYDTFLEYAGDELAESISKDKFENEVVAYVNSKGTFQSYGKQAVIGQKYEKTGEDCGVVVMAAEYEDGTIQYTISFTKDMKLNGLWLK